MSETTEDRAMPEQIIEIQNAAHEVIQARAHSAFTDVLEKAKEIGLRDELAMDFAFSVISQLAANMVFNVATTMIEKIPSWPPDAACNKALDEVRVRSIASMQEFVSRIAPVEPDAANDEKLN